MSGPLSPNCKFIAFRLYGFGTILISDKELPEGRRKYAGSLVLVQNKLLFKVRKIKRGSPSNALSMSKHRLKGNFTTGSQEPGSYDYSRLAGRRPGNC